MGNVIIIATDMMVLLAHEVKQHGKVVADADMKHCPNEGCTQKFITQEQLSRHLRLICQRGADIPCDDPTCKRGLQEQGTDESTFCQPYR